MPFIKTGLAVNPAKIVPEENTPVGTEKDGKVWDGEKWVTKAEWEAKQGKPGNG